MGSWDPSDLLDFLDTKKKLPGERKEVFPGGVPGLEQGVPKDLYKGAAEQPQPDQQNAAVAPPPEEPKTKKSKARSKKPATASHIRGRRTACIPRISAKRVTGDSPGTVGRLSQRNHSGMPRIAPTDRPNMPVRQKGPATGR